MSERLYVGKFTVNKVPITHIDKFPNDLPKRDEPNPDGPSQAPFKKLFEFPITALVHNTHTEEQEGICQKQDGKARFKANEKLSMSTMKLFYKNGWTANHSPEKANTKVLPGRYVWFSMKPTLPEDREFNKKDYNVPYVNGTTFYGPWSFTFDYSKLISSYKKHIQNHSDPGKRDATVVLRNGGTLKYQREICYVVIVTHSKDTLHKNTRYPIIENEEVLTITTQQHGDMSLPMCVFHPRCIPPPSVPKGSPPPPNWAGYDWDQLGYYDHVVFAIHCDWEGEITNAKSEVNPKDEKELRKETTPVLKITLPPGQPYNHLEDCARNAISDKDIKKKYYKFHPLCRKHRKARRGGRKECYLEEYALWNSSHPRADENEMKSIPLKKHRKQ